MSTGLVGGFLATGVATAVFALAGRDRPLPAAELCARLLESADRPGEAVWIGLGVHAIAGTLAGAVFPSIVGLVVGRTAAADPPAVVGLGVGYGLVLLAVHVGGVLHGAVGRPLDREVLAELLVVHVIYGTVLGAWSGLAA